MTEINVFTIRLKEDNSIIYAEGVPHDELYSYFELDEKYFGDGEIKRILSQPTAWEFHNGKMKFKEEIRHLKNYYYDKILINTREKYIFTDEKTLRLIK